MSVHRIRNRVLAATTALVVGGGLFAGLAPIACRASSHREAPLTAADPQIDNTDLYAFVSPDKPNTVTLVSSWIPFEEPAGGPNFYPWAEHTNYDINIDNNGDASADITYRWKFTTHYRTPDTFLYNTGPVTSLNDPDLNFYQTYDLTADQATATTSNVCSTTRRSRRATSAPPRCRTTTATCSTRAITTFGAERRPELGRAVRRPVLPRPAGVRPRCTGRTSREAGDDTLDRVQREHVRAAGPEEDAPRADDVGHRHLDHGVASERCGSQDGRRHVDVQRQERPGLAPGHAARERGRRARWALKDYFNASKPKDDAQYLPRSRTPSSRTC